MKLRWEADPELSVARASYIVATGARCTDSKTEQLLIGTVTKINHRLVSAAIDIGRFWTCYMDRSVAGDTSNTAVSISLIRSGCSEMQVEQTARAIRSRLSEAKHLFYQRFPKLDEQLPLRVGPIRERWEAIGPGLLREVERQVWQNSPPEDWWPESITVLTVQPLVGGSGGFDPDVASIWIEAMLTDADRLIPEVLRVAWLITSLAIETHIRSRTGERMLSSAWSLVSVPLVLTAAARLEMFPANEFPIAKAVQMWRGGTTATIKTLDLWWQEYRKSKTPLPIALQRLEKSLQPTTGRS